MATSSVHCRTAQSNQHPLQLSDSFFGLPFAAVTTYQARHSAVGTYDPSMRKQTTVGMIPGCPAILVPVYAPCVFITGDDPCRSKGIDYASQCTVESHL